MLYGFVNVVSRNQILKMVVVRSTVFNPPDPRGYENDPTGEVWLNALRYRSVSQFLLDKHNQYRWVMEFHCLATAVCSQDTVTLSKLLLETLGEGSTAFDN